jgi:predicted AlkP superfamily pyrophosphatase or phosphodiesterase
VRKTIVINAVALTPSLIGQATPNLARLQAQGASAAIEGVLPAVTCSVQATYLTGVWPAQHGIVGNGWYFRDECEVKFWRQSDGLVGRPRVWDEARRIDPSFTCANLFWWNAMYSTADYTLTPRPMYPADGRKLPDVWTHPPELRWEIQRKLGQFPLFSFWGPAASIASTRWIADAAIEVDRRVGPTLSLVYLPHLDYALQRHGPDLAKVGADLRALDEVIGGLMAHFAGQGASVIVLSEYGIASVSRPVHLNRILREHGLITVRRELGRELLDAGASRAFAVADHQVAHVYVNDRACLDKVRELLAATPGVGEVLDDDAKRASHLDHPRSGDLIVVAAPDAWFTYYYWLDDGKAPDFARTVDIHRKPGYDPAELFLDPSLCCPKLKIAWTLLKRKLGFRSLLNVIGLDATLVRGSHGRPAPSPAEGAVLLTSQKGLLDGPSLAPTQVRDVILRHLNEDAGRR